MNIHRCALCHAIVLIVPSGDTDPVELENKTAAHEIMEHM